MLNKNTMVIVALTVDNRSVTLYGADGDILTLQQGDPRITPIIETARPALLQGKSATVSIDFKNNTNYQDMENQTNGVVRFFRIAKHKLTQFFEGNEEKASPTVSPMQLGKVPNYVPPAPVISNDEKIELAQKKLEEMGALPTTHNNFDAPLAESEDTIVAMVGDAVIPDVHHLHNQIRQSIELKDCKGFTRFMERLSAVINERRHSVEDLMKFMERGDLPIADDGCIVIYKRLDGSQESTVFTDCHTSRIKQRVGSLVSVKENLVDQNRRRDCSNGLHVASLSYLSGFSGNVTVIAKVRPEDVFAVPEYNTNKMRVSAYHILARLTEEQRRIVNNGGSICDAEGGKQLLNDVLCGNHIGVTQLVQVTEHQGHGVIYSEVNEHPVQDVAEVTPEPTPTVIKDTLDIEAKHDDIPASAPIKPTELVQETPEPVKKPVTQSRADIIRDVLKEGSSQVTANKLRVIKKKAKKTYKALGMTAKEVTTIEAMLKKYPAGK